MCASRGNKHKEQQPNRTSGLAAHITSRALPGKKPALHSELPLTLLGPLSWGLVPTPAPPQSKGVTWGDQQGDYMDDITLQHEQN